MRRTILVALITLVAVALSGPAIHGQSCDCEVSDRYERAYDELLRLSEEEKEQAEAIHLPWGVPAEPEGASNEELLHQEHFVVKYDHDLKLPLWAAYRLSDNDARAQRTRLDCFRRDVRLEEPAAAFCEDYEEPVFDRGHLVPRADMNRSEPAMINTFVFSNIAPQHDRFNRMIWRYLEGYVRDWAELKGEVYVITGAVFDGDEDGTRDADDEVERIVPEERVGIPTHFYKIVLHERPNGFIETQTVLLVHQDSSPPKRDARPFLEERLTDIDAIEELTGIDFLVGLREEDGGANKEQAVEAFVADSLWPTP